MKAIEQKITDKFAAYHGDCCDILPGLPKDSIHMSIYSPPFCGLYQYSSSERDMSNCRTYEEFFEHYEFIVKELGRVTMPGRWTVVHCMDVPPVGKSAANLGSGLKDFPGDIIRLHEKHGWQYFSRCHIWKEPLGVRLRTMAKGLTHKQIVDDSTLTHLAHSDYLLFFRNKGTNPIPVTHKYGLMEYAGESVPPEDIQSYRGYTGDQKKNLYSHWIWRRYASSNWDDIRISRVLDYEESRGEDDEKHVHPLQLDVIERAVILGTNEGETVFTPFMGVGSEVAGAVMNGRRGVGVELKETYYRQAVKNLEKVSLPRETGLLL